MRKQLNDHNNNYLINNLIIFKIENSHNLTVFCKCKISLRVYYFYRKLLLSRELSHSFHLFSFMSHSETSSFCMASNAKSKLIKQWIKIASHVSALKYLSLQFTYLFAENSSLLDKI